MKKSFHDLKEGDEVGIDLDGYCSKKIFVGSVVRTTPKQIVVKIDDYPERKFYRDNGREVGRSKDYRQPFLVELTTEVREQIEKEELVDYIDRLQTHVLFRLDLDQLRRIAAITKEEK